MRTRLRWLSWLGVLCWFCCPSRGQAQASLPVLLAQPKQLRVDGDLGEWRGARFVRLGDDDAGRSEIALAHDAQGLYVGARVFDDAFVRSAHPGPHEDAVVVTIALPAAGNFATSELWLFAGRIGQTAASAQLMASGSKQLRPLGRSAQIVEGPAASGYVLEAFVPWASMPHGADWPFARGAVRLHDVDRAGRPADDIPRDALGKSGARLPWLRLDGGPIEAVRGFLDQKNLSSAVPLLDWVGDVHGDARAERVLVVGTYLVLSGIGTNFSFADLPVSRAADVRAADMLDVTGDGKPEVVVRLRSQNELAEREVWRVFDLRSDTAQPIFGIETRKQTKRGSVEASVAVSAGGAGRPAQITVRAGNARGLSADDYTESPAQEVVPIPVPWGTWLERVYAWDGHGFALHKERANPAARSAATEPADAARASAPNAGVASASASGITTESASASVPSVAELVQGYRAARGIPANQQPRFAQRVNLAGDPRPEALSLFGRDCVVVGEGFRAGRDFFYFTLPARDGSDVLRLFTGDVTGDGRHELFARIRQQIGAVTREIVYVYTFAAESLVPLLAAEVSRAQGTQSITNGVTLVPEGNHVALQIAPGAARGWSAADYPFSSESRDGVAPLLLPWMDKPTHYQYDGQRLSPRLSKD